jgi:hypothetical protein
MAKNGEEPLEFSTYSDFMEIKQKEGQDMEDFMSEWHDTYRRAKRAGCE